MFILFPERQRAPQSRIVTHSDHLRIGRATLKSNCAAISIALKNKETFARYLTIFRDSPSFRDLWKVRSYSVLNRVFFIRRLLILASKVEGGIPSALAAPDGPAIRPLLFAKTSSMISFS
jgi:hypothetical protein